MLSLVEWNPSSSDLPLNSALQYVFYTSMFRPIAPTFHLTTSQTPPSASTHNTAAPLNTCSRCMSMYRRTYFLFLPPSTCPNQGGRNAKRKTQNTNHTHACPQHGYIHTYPPADPARIRMNIQAPAIPPSRQYYRNHVWGPDARHSAASPKGLGCAGGLP